MDELLFAILATFLIYLICKIVSISIGFYIYEKAKKTIIYTVYSYFGEINIEYVNLDILKKIIEKKFEKMNIRKKVEFVRIKWTDKGIFKLDFKLNIKKNYPVYSYSFNINSIKETFKLEKKRGVDFE